MFTSQPWDDIETCQLAHRSRLEKLQHAVLDAKQYSLCFPLTEIYYLPKHRQNHWKVYPRSKAFYLFYVIVAYCCILHHWPMVVY